MVQVSFDVHPALLLALQRLADNKHCTLDQLLLRLINEGLTVELKIIDLKVLDQTRKNT